MSPAPAHEERRGIFKMKGVCEKQAPDLEAPANPELVEMSPNIALVEAALFKAAWIKAKARLRWRFLSDTPRQ